ncbi:MAG: hypothetical protein R2940_13595 [Syntrophotaleaceae bacterium]
MIDRLWKFLAGIRLTLWLLVLLTVNLFVGSFYAKFMPVFGRLNHRLFPEWMLDHADIHSWWLFTLFFLLFLLGANTLACTLERINFLWRRRNHHRRSIFSLLMAPSIMHFCFLFIIGGHALTEFAGSKQRLRAEVGEAVTLDDREITLLDRRFDFWQEPQLQGALRRATAILQLKKGESVEQREISILEPVFWEGYNLHLGRAGKPGTDALPPLEIVVKRDPGLMLILLGNTVLCLLMLWYFPQINKIRNGGHSK